MNVCVLGLWHLGTVTAACLAAAGHQVVGLDFDASVIADLQAGKPPLFEPGLAELVQQGLAAGTLQFTTDMALAWRSQPEIIWVTYDTPVDADDHADVDFVLAQVRRLLAAVAPGTLFLISSQLPVGSTRQLEAECPTATFAYSPENLRLGKAIQVFTQPDRVVVGVRHEADKTRLSALLRPFTTNIEWMAVESAEMTKHALNAFLAVSVTFINEVAALCEQVGADAKEVERGLKSEGRIGPRAYLSPGNAFAGGTLARDVAFLSQLSAAHQLESALLGSVRASNEAHKGWAQRKLRELLGDVRGQGIAVWGLTYKPGTDTLRRSSAVELCEALHAAGAQVQAFDPAVKQLPPELAAKITLCPSVTATLANAAAIVIATEWPEFQTITAEILLAAMPAPLVVDGARFCAKNLGHDPHIRYAAVGKAQV